jgi:hypothetical protein
LDPKPNVGGLKPHVGCAASRIEEQNGLSAALKLSRAVSFSERPSIGLMEFRSEDIPEYAYTNRIVCRAFSLDYIYNTEVGTPINKSDSRRGSGPRVRRKFTYDD